MSPLASRRPTLTLVITAVAVLVAGVLLAARGTAPVDDMPAPVVAGTPPGEAATEPPSPPHAAQAPDEATARLDSAEPQEFARAVAVTLFDWDTTTDRLQQVAGRLLAVADPTGLESPGLVADLAAYLPSPRAWDLLHGHDTRQRLEVHRVVVPAAWATAQTQAPAGTLAPGTTAYTITGTRHRAGTWAGRPVATKRPVAFTVFVVCGPTYDRCHLLRLSRPDEPLT